MSTRWSITGLVVMLLIVCSQLCPAGEGCGGCPKAKAAAEKAKEGCGGCPRAKATEQKAEVAAADLPAVVTAAVLKALPDGKITGSEKEVEDGKVVYDVEVMVGDAKYEVEVSAEGEVIEIEQEGKDEPDGDNNDEDDDVGKELWCE